MLGIRSTFRYLTLGLVLVFASTGPAQAQDKKLTARQKKRARNLVKQAQRQKTLGDRQKKRRRTKRAMAHYRRAVIGYRQAYEITEHPSLIFKLAEVYDARGEKKWALRGYKKYLELAPKGHSAVRATDRATELRADVEEAQSEGRTLPEGESKLDPTSVFGPEKVEEPEEPKEPEEPEEPVVEDKPEPVVEKPVAKKKKKKTKKPGRLWRWSGMGTAGAGLVSLGLGIKFGLDARSASDTLSKNDDAWTAEDRALIEDGRRAQTMMLVFTSIGVAALAGGTYLYYRGHKAGQKRESARVVWAPQLTPTSASFTVAGWF